MAENRWRIERVRWHEAIDRRDVHGNRIDGVFKGNDFETGGYTTEGNDPERADADGMVTVLREEQADRT